MGGGKLLKITSMYFSFYVSVCQTVCITSIVIVGLILTKLVNLANTEVKIEVLGLSLIIAPPPPVSGVPKLNTPIFRCSSREKGEVNQNAGL